ncbi:hypothetical protein EXN66_Car013894 [Channa argus]|uniref:Uncharacterized protein n=1 Tax=Channa argus TaxID=215402 RepID=A0A6G1Q794_CHAAH|nr:hypothetical protein EXN66_Car013894 [Channa argus]
MKDGDVSVILNNVSISDTGTYICRIIATEGDQDRMGTEFLSVTNLTVTEEMDSSLISHLSSHYLLTGGGAGHTEDRGKTDKMITNGENKDLNVGLFVGLSVVAVILGLFAFIIITKRKCVKETYRRVSQRTGEHSYTDKCIFGTCCSTEA